MRGPSPSTVLIAVIASVVLTTFHFADNYFAYESYPPSELVTPTLILVAWPLLTAFGVAGYLLYRRGRFTSAQLCLLVYSYTGLGSLGHFLTATPAELTTRGLVSVLIDGAIGAVVLAVTVWSIIAVHLRPATPRSQTTG